MTGRNLCENCNGMGYIIDPIYNFEKVCDECDGDGIQYDIH